MTDVVIHFEGLGGVELTVSVGAEETSNGATTRCFAINWRKHGTNQAEALLLARYAAKSAG